LKSIDYSKWVGFIQGYDAYDDLSSEDQDLYMQLSSLDNPEWVRGFEDQLDKFMYVPQEDECIYDWLKKHSMPEVSVLEELCRLHHYSNEPIQKLFGVVNKTKDVETWILSRWGSCDAIVELANEYVPDFAIEKFPDLEGYYARRLYDVIGITIKDALNNLERFSILMNSAHSIVSEFNRSDRYKELAKEILKKYVQGETVNDVLVQVFGSPNELLGTNCPWEGAWMKRMHKLPVDFESLSTMSPVFGIVDGVNCLYTNVGIIAEQPVSVGDAPVFVIDENAPVYSVALAAPIETDYVVPVIRKRVFCKQEVELGLRAC
jgi:hypothetical protein